MKAVRLYGYGDVDQMRYEDVPEPAPGADEVLVKVVTNFKRGDRVLGLVSLGYAEFVAAKASAFGRIPDGLNVEEAGVLPLILLTGTQLIEVGAQVTAGQTILITGALGSVGRTAVHMAKKRGARMIAGVRAKQRDEAKELHADGVVARDAVGDEGRLGENFAGTLRRIAR